MSIVLDGSNLTTSGVINSGTAVTASGTSVDFTIPTGAKRITVMFSGVSTSSSSRLQVQIGSGSFTTSGYVSVGTGTSATSLSTQALTSGFPIANATSATDSASIVATIVNITGNTWLWASTGQRSSTDQAISSGILSISGTLDRVRITTVNGTDTFDAGTINILYE